MDLTKPSQLQSNDINAQSLDIQKTDNKPKLDLKLKILIGCTAIFCLLIIILLIISASNTETVNNTVTAVSPFSQDINHMIKDILNTTSLIVSIIGLILISSTGLEMAHNLLKTEPTNYKQIMMLITISLMFIFNRQISTCLTQLILLMIKPTANNPEANIRGILWLI
jgi:heme/copper-type cytochrome/quinol oxidase subunit 3